MKGFFVAYWTKAKKETVRACHVGTDMAFDYLIPGFTLILLGLGLGLVGTQMKMDHLVGTLNDLDEKYFELAVLRHEDAAIQIMRLEDEVRQLRLTLDHMDEYRVSESMITEVRLRALEEQIPENIAFKLVDIESGFRQRARGQAGEIGLTQIKPTTARIFDPKVTEAELFQSSTNLRLGFRYLRSLYNQYKDWTLALTAYNMGPTRLSQLRTQGARYQTTYADWILSDD